jgi:8-oxo-dGTP diphosphatase
MMPEAAAREVHAAGVVLWRGGAGQVLAALVHRRRYDDWSLPKGKRMAHEHILVTAVREVQEETGIRPVLGRRLPSTSYLADGRPKRVDYWAARPADPRFLPPGGFVPNDEVDDVAWLDLAAARDRLSYARDREVLDAFAAGRPGSAPLILLRHAATVSKAAWRDAGHADDLGRPLSARGTAQAKALAGILDCFPPARLVSSAAERCVATVRPYAALRGTPVETEPAFTVEAVPSSPGTSIWNPTPAARDRIAGLVAGAAPAVVCLHRQNVPELMDWACQLLGAPRLAGRPLPKGGFWVLQVAFDPAGRASGLASAERHELGA